MNHLASTEIYREDCRYLNTRQDSIFRCWAGRCI